MKNLGKIVLLFVGLAVSGCSNDLPKLTAEQKAAFKSTLGSTAAAYQTPNGHMNSRGGFSSISSSPTSSATPGQASRSTVKSPKNTNAKTKPMDDQLGTDLDNLNCQWDASQKQVGKQGLIGFSISGTQCPIEASMSLTGSESSLTIQGHYNVQDANYRSLNDVDSFALLASLTYKESSSNVKVEGTLRGRIHSQAHGDVSISANLTLSASTSSQYDDSPYGSTAATSSPFGSPSSGSGSFGSSPSHTPPPPPTTRSHSSDNKASFSLRATYPKYEAELKIIADDNGVKYYINGEEESEQEIAQILGKDGFDPLNSSSTFMIF